MYVIAGLGNPGKKYENTRHNAGFDVIDLLCEKYGISVDTKKHKGLIGKGLIEGERVLLVKPQTYMNLSGECIRAVMAYYDLPIGQLIVICDDVNLDIGNLRIRANGSAGGHNGLKNIILELASQDFTRVRVGVGKQPERMDLISHVLSHFTEEEREELAPAEARAAEAAAFLTHGTAYEAMNLFNGKRQ